MMLGVAGTQLVWLAGELGSADLLNDGPEQIRPPLPICFRRGHGAVLGAAAVAHLVSNFKTPERWARQGSNP